GSYVAAYVLVYKWVVVPVWGYAGFHDRAAPAREAVAGASAALPSLWVPIKLKRPSQIVYWLLYLLVLVPACLVPIYALENQSRGPVLLAASLVAVFALTGLVYRLPLLPLPRVHLQSYEFSLILILLSTAFYALLASSFGLRFHFVSLEDTYTVRAQFKDSLEQA